MVVRSYHVTLHQTALFSQNTGREGLSAELSQDHPRLNLIQKYRAKTFVVFLPLKVYKLCYCLWHKKQSLLFKELLVKTCRVRDGQQSNITWCFYFWATLGFLVSCWKLHLVFVGGLWSLCVLYLCRPFWAELIVVPIQRLLCCWFDSPRTELYVPKLTYSDCNSAQRLSWRSSFALVPQIIRSWNSGSPYLL